MNDLGQIRVLLVDDDEDDYILTRGLFAQMRGHSFQVEWFKSYRLGLEAMARNQHDICLIDYRLGAKTGIDLLREGLERGCQAPIILLTGSGQHEVDVQAMKAGAADYLVKSTIQVDALERSIRYAIERKRLAAVAAFEQAGLAAFGAEVGLALTQRDSLSAILYRCADSMVRFLNVHLARIWILHPADKMLHLKASAGAINDVQSHENPLATLSPDQCLIGDGKPILVNRVADDPRVPGQDWVRREGVVAYSGYPLMLENRLLGLVSIFSLTPLSEAVLQGMSSVANGIALCIERKRSEEALDASEDRFRSVVESLKEVVFQVNEFGHWTSLNPAWTEITGFDVKETLGNLFLEFIHHDDRQRNSFIFLQIIERKLDYCRFETRLLTKDGKIRWVEVYAQLTLNSDGTVLGTSGSLTDITDRKQAETQIQKLAAFPQVNPNPVLEFDAQGDLTYFNEAAGKLATSLGQTHPQAVLPPNARDLVQRCLASGQSKLREEVSMAGKTISWSFFPITASGVVHCYGTDITEMLNLEAQFRHSQKLESVGQLAAGVAHDFNNILTVIQGYADFLRARCDGDPGMTRPLHQISEAARRAAGLTRQLLMFSRKQIIQTKVIDLNAVLRNLSNMLSRLLGEDIAVVNEYAADLPAIEADSGMMEQVIMNLSVNARDAMPKGGQLLIVTSWVEMDDAFVRLHPEARIGRAVQLSITDTGCGMSREIVGRIFEPFFSTKEVGKGTGLGLPTVYGIVSQHQGWIEVKSEVGTGTTFNIFLPAVARLVEPAPEASSTGQPIAKGRNETILLVEDEPVLREWVKQVLEDNAYRVVEAGTGVEALKVWDEQNGKVDLVVTDMVMPEGMTGRDLALQLRSRTPGLRIIYTSGYSAEVGSRDAELPGIPFLPKPYGAPQLTQLVRECLDGKLAERPAPVAA
ncbi:MAG: Blue-light-activated protein [Pedosphaera sp.]|nr:Blue-light-activated protein [Pedosphaera sp.]